MILGNRSLHKIVEDDRDDRSSHSLDRVPSRPSTMERRGTVDSLVLHRPKSVERRLTLDSVRTISPARFGHVHPQRDHQRVDSLDRWDQTPRNTPDIMQRDRVDSLESDLSSVRCIFPQRSLSVDEHPMTETEKRYLASLDERRDALDTGMLPPIGGRYKTSRAEAGRWSLPADLQGFLSSSFSSNASDVRAKTPVSITRLKREDSFGYREELYKVDMDDGLTYVCRKRAESITNPELMTEEERRIHGFLQGTARLSQRHSSISSEDSYDDRAVRSHRIYSLGESKLIVDPVMSKFAVRGPSRRHRQKHKHDRRGSNPPTILPPIYKQETFKPQERDFSIPPGPRTTSDFTDEVFEELKHCRYLRPRPKRFQDIPEDIIEEEESLVGL
jgi:hypothetical protein